MVYSWSNTIIRFDYLNLLSREIMEILLYFFFFFFGNEVKLKGIIGRLRFLKIQKIIKFKSFSLGTFLRFCYK